MINDHRYFTTTTELHPTTGHPFPRTKSSNTIGYGLNALHRIKKHQTFGIKIQVVEKTRDSVMLWDILLVGLGPFVDHLMQIKAKLFLLIIFILQ